MSQDLFNQLLEQLIPYYKEHDFDSVFEKVTANETANSKFLIKMELARVFTPCVRIIDFRSGSAETKHYSYNGSHIYIPLNECDFFENLIKIFHNEYTMGVYEKITKYHKDKQKKEQAKIASGEGDSLSLEEQIAKMDVESVKFASYFYRSEERMNYISPALLFIDGKLPLHVKTSDISCGGIKLALEKNVDIPSGTMCQVTFTGLQKLIADPNNKLEMSPYKILTKIEKNGKYWIVAIKTDKDQGFTRIIDDFIQSNKLKYSVSVDNLLSTVETKGYEQFYLPRTTALPLFFSNDPVPKLLYCLKSENNQSNIEYWRDERNEDKLTSLFNYKRMSEIIEKSEGSFYETYIYTFRHMIRSHIYFFSATIDELERDGNKELFFTVGSKRPSWKVYKFSMEKIDINQNNVEKYIESGTPQVEKERSLKELLRIGYVGQIIEVGNDEHGCSDYQMIQISNFNANELQVYAHNLNVSPCKIEMLHYLKMRKEPRYIHKTAVAMKLANGNTVVGWTKDISTMGLQLELSDTVECKAGDIVYLSLPKLQELTKDMKLKNLPYSVVHVNQSVTIIHLAVYGDPAEHVGRKFFNLLIESNHGTLTASKELQNLSSMSKSLRFMFTQHIFTSPLYLSKNKPNRLGALGIIDNERPFYKLLKECETKDSQILNVYPLFHDKLLRIVLLEPLKKMQRYYNPAEVTLLITKDLDASGNMIYVTKLETEFKTYNDKRLFCAKALKRNEFWAVRLFITRTGKPDIDYIAKELDYISKYAIHKARRLEETVWSIIGICDMVDVSEEVIIAMNLPRKLLSH
jgi:hypothetical protein